MSSLNFIFTILIYIIFSIIIIGVIYLIYDSLHIKIQNWINSKRNQSWYSSIVPDMLLKSISPDEKILYKSAKIKHRKKLRIIQLGVYFGFLGFTLSIFGLIGDIISDFSLFLIIIAFLIPLVAVRGFSREFKKNSFFIFTDKRLHYYVYQFKTKSGNVASYQYSRFIGVIYKKSFYDKRGNHGTIEFITTDLIPSRVTLKNINNIQFHRKLVDSILYHFGSLYHKWSQLENNANFQFPIVYYTSEQKIKKNIKSIRNNLISCSIMIIISIIVYYVVDIIYIDEIWEFYLVFGGILIFDVLMLIILLRVVFQMIFRTSNKNASMTIKENEIIIKKQNKSDSIQFNQNITLDFAKSNKPMNPPKNSEDIDFIKIFNLHDKSEKIKFGPLNQLRNLLPFLFSYLTVLKANSKYLLPKNELYSLDSKFPSELISEIQKEHFIKQDQLDKVKVRINQVIPHHQIDFYQYIQNYLDQHENIIAIARPTTKMKRHVIKLIIGICCFFITIYFGSSLFYPIFPAIFLPFNPIFDILIPIASLTGVVMLCCLSPLFLAANRKLKNFSYLLTDKKILWVEPKLIIPIPLNLILSIQQTINKDKTYNIQIMLKRQIVELPGMLKSMLSLSCIPQENDFYSLLTYLKSTQERIIEEQKPELKVKNSLDQSLLDEQYREIMLKDFKKNVLPFIIIIAFSSFTYVFTFTFNIWWLGITFPIIGTILYIYVKKKYKDDNKRNEDQNRRDLKPIRKMYCVNCGKLIDDNVNFCPFCSYRYKVQ